MTRHSPAKLGGALPLMLPPPATPTRKPTTRWSLRVPRDAALVMLRNNILSLAGLLLFNWFFPIYSGLKALVLPTSWTETFSKIELGVLTMTFGTNILVSVVSLRYPRASYPPLRIPSKPVVNVTPVRRPVKGLGTSPVARPSPKSYTSSGYASTPLSTPSRLFNYSIPSSAGSPLNQSGTSSLSTSSSYNNSPLAAYMGRHTVRTGRPIDPQLLDSLTGDDESTF
ncbi:hypothetical protein JB92DRAFT_2872154 [Gautieria morchelliformis]|nr:hypothetical protein JB92DRAFT_2872154 [Gautieria morchelliformis]